MEFYSRGCWVSSLPHSLVVQLRSKLPVTVQDNLQAAIGAYGRYSCTRDPTCCSHDKYLAQPHINQKKETDTIFLACLACLLTNKSVNIRIIYRKARTQCDEMSCINYTATISINYTTKTFNSYDESKGDYYLKYLLHMRSFVFNKHYEDDTLMLKHSSWYVI